MCVGQGPNMSFLSVFWFYKKISMNFLRKLNKKGPLYTCTTSTSYLKLIVTSCLMFLQCNTIFPWNISHTRVHITLFCLFATKEVNLFFRTFIFFLDSIPMWVFNVCSWLFRSVLQCKKNIFISFFLHYFLLVLQEGKYKRHTCHTLFHISLNTWMVFAGHLFLHTVTTSIYYILITLLF